MSQVHVVDENSVYKHDLNQIKIIFGIILSTPTIKSFCNFNEQLNKKK